MKKFMCLLAVFTMMLACTNNNVNEYDENYTSAQGQDEIEKGQSCPPGDRNCNGIPDSEE